MKPTWPTIFSVYFFNFIYSLYMFWTSRGPSSRGVTVFIRHLVFCCSVQLAVWCAGFNPAHHTASSTENTGHQVGFIHKSAYLFGAFTREMGKNCSQYFSLRLLPRFLSVCLSVCACNNWLTVERPFFFKFDVLNIYQVWFKNRTRIMGTSGEGLRAFLRKSWA
jgi:hypothetical protein